MSDTTRRNITFPDSLWERIQAAAMDETVRTREHVTASEWIRDACERKLAQRTEGG